jgi:hypothetical protein
MVVGRGPPPEAKRTSDVPMWDRSCPRARSRVCSAPRQGVPTVLLAKIMEAVTEASGEVSRLALRHGGCRRGSLPR